MKQRIFLIFLTLALVLALTACTANEQPQNPFSHDLIFTSLDEIIQAKKEVSPENDEFNLKGLDIYYIPVYAEEHCNLNGLILNSSLIFTPYSSKDGDRRYCQFTMYRPHVAYPDGKTSLASMIEGFNLKPWTVEGVYYEEYTNFPEEGPTRQFYWLHDGEVFRLTIFAKWMDEIQEKDPDALKGSLFELRKVELK